MLFKYRSNNKTIKVMEKNKVYYCLRDYEPYVEDFVYTIKSFSSYEEAVEEANSRIEERVKEYNLTADNFTIVKDVESAPVGSMVFRRNLLDAWGVEVSSLMIFKYEENIY